jgi:hypothetical protein
MTTDPTRHHCEVVMSTNHVLPAVPTTTDPAKPRTESEEKLWQALSANPGSSAVALSITAGIGKSTASKILARWDKDGLVTRTPGVAGKGPRPADLWSIAPGDQDADDEPIDDQPADHSHTTTTASGSEKAGKPERLAPGALRGMVEDYLRDNSGEFSPNTIGKALCRSSGAVHNALEKLVDSGDAVRVSDKPKKYTLTVGAQ